MDFTIILAGILLIFGTLFIMCAVVLLKNYLKLNRAECISVYAKISDIIEEKSSVRSRSSSVYYFPVLDFRLNGDNYSIKSRTGIQLRKSYEEADKDSFAIGDMVGVRIYNNDVNTAIIDCEHTLKTDKVLGIGFGVLGSLLFIIGALIFII